MIPTQIELIEPVFIALRSLGGSANISEIRDKVIEMLQLSDEIVDEPHKGSASQQTELEYQLAWARTRLKAFGAITNSQRGVWMITPKFSDNDTVSKTDVVEFIKSQRLASKNPAEAKALAEDDDPTNDNVEIYYEVRGEGRPLFMLPGWTCTTNFWKHNVDELSKTCKVICMDMRGHGESEKVLHSHRISRYAMDVKNLLDYLDGLLLQD